MVDEQEYTVKWNIVVEARSPEEAAAKAWNKLQSPFCSPNSLDVFNAKGESEVIVGVVDPDDDFDEEFNDE